jgi:2-polyprenyl-3-methyl-5-hydroxy-6-metoxy-1,4-benzoquinol methylase
MSTENYLDVNQASWDARTHLHIESDFYSIPKFIKGKSSLNSIELDLLGDINNKTLLHLQCHFGQDSISLSRLGAEVTGIDLSPKAIEEARKLATSCQSTADFICSDLYKLPEVLDAQYDLVFTSYGTIGWLPDIEKWAEVVQQFLKPGGQLIFVEFHPVVWMFDDAFKTITHDYFKGEAIIESSEESYTNQKAATPLHSITWNHSLSSVVGALLGQGLELQFLEEYDYSPYPCFENAEEQAPGIYRIAHIKKRIPMVYALKVQKPL